MRYKDFKLTEDQLLELKMSPTALAKTASTLNAVAGIEFEMYVPDVEKVDDNDHEYGGEDYSNDPRPNSIDDVIAFYEDNNGDMEAVKLRMYEDFNMWLYEQAQHAWIHEELTLENLEDYIKDHIREKYEGDDEEEIEEIIKYALSSRQDSETREAFEQYYEDNYDEFERDYIDNNYGYESQAEWLRDQRYNEMSDLANAYELQWPHYEPSGGSTSIHEVGNSFAEVVAHEVKTGMGYHTVSRGNFYIIEPDSSLDSPNDEEDAGLEFISPPLPLKTMIADMGNIIEWANSYGCYTNNTCGLHMNVSIEGVDHSKLDYVKLALFVGEKYVLEQFNRVGNSYATSVISKLTGSAQSNPENALKLLELLKNQLAKAALNILHNGMTNHTDGLNVNSNYVEFRYAGNDWLNMNFDDLTSILNRYVVAYNIACNPEAYKEEYAKKLYKLISPADDRINTLKYFSDYAAGKLPKLALKSFVKDSQRKRIQMKDPTMKHRFVVKIKPMYVDQVYAKLPHGAEALALTPQEAIQVVRQRFAMDEKIPDTWFDVSQKN